MTLTTEELVGLMEALKAVKAARAACTPDAPESVWQAKDEAERVWEAAVDYTNPDAAVNALPEHLALKERAEATVWKIVKAVAELPDRTSPDDWPEAMLVTSDELATIIRANLTGPTQ